MYYSLLIKNKSMKKIIMVTAIFFAGLSFVSAHPKSHHHKKGHHKTKHTKTAAVVNKKDDKNDKVKSTTTMKTKSDKKK